MRPAILVLNPRDDADFTAAAERLAAEVEQPDDLARALRALYPAALVRPRSLSGERVPIWYVYRDGSWVPRRSEDGGVNGD